LSNRQFYRLSFGGACWRDCVMPRRHRVRAALTRTRPCLFRPRPCPQGRRSRATRRRGTRARPIRPCPRRASLAATARPTCRPAFPLRDNRQVGNGTDGVGFSYQRTNDTDHQENLIGVADSADTENARAARDLQPPRRRQCLAVTSRNTVRSRSVRPAISKKVSSGEVSRRRGPQRELGRSRTRYRAADAGAVRARAGLRTSSLTRKAESGAGERPRLVRPRHAALRQGRRLVRERAAGAEHERRFHDRSRSR
jgi:hypothetical protein